MISARNLALQLALQRPDWRFTFYYSRKPAAPSEPPHNLTLAYRPTLTSRARRWAWEQLVLPAIIRREHHDVLLCYGGYSTFASAVPQISVWHNPTTTSKQDICTRSLAAEFYLRFQRVVQGLSIHRAQLNVFQTEESCRIAREWWRIADRRRAIIPCGIDSSRRGIGSPPKFADRGRFALAVATSYFHKNLETLIDAMGIYRDSFGEALPLKIAGACPYPRYHKALLTRVAKRGLNCEVEFLGERCARDVRFLYQTALVYVTTSLLETFGLTTIEAMSNGLPVVAGRVSCIPEVCGNAVLYCDPQDPLSVAKRLRELTVDPQKWTSMQRLGLKRAASFGWEMSARRYHQEMERLILEAGRNPSDLRARATSPSSRTS